MFLQLWRKFENYGKKKSKVGNNSNWTIKFVMHKAAAEILRISAKIGPFREDINRKKVSFGASPKIK